MKNVIITFIISIIPLVAWGQNTQDGTINQVDSTRQSTNPTGNKRDYRKDMREGNRSYDAGKPIGAENSYRKALNAEKNPQAMFNLGDALYRQKKYDEAIEQFSAAADAMTSKEDKAKAYHNIGNSFLEQQKLKESIDAYKQSLRNNPNDQETKYNLSYAMRQLQQQQNQDKDDKDKKDQQDKKDQNKDQDKKDQKDQQDQDKKDKDQQDKDQQKQDQQKDQKDQKDQKKQQEISPEDAQRILDAMQQDEKNLQEKLQKEERKGHRGKVEKNW